MSTSPFEDVEKELIKLCVFNFTTVILNIINLLRWTQNKMDYVGQMCVKCDMYEMKKDDKVIDNHKMTGSMM
jgi:hypothetical protein